MSCSHTYEWPTRLNLLRCPTGLNGCSSVPASGLSSAGFWSSLVSSSLSSRFSAPLKSKAARHKQVKRVRPRRMPTVSWDDRPWRRLLFAILHARARALQQVDQLLNRAEATRAELQEEPTGEQQVKQAVILLS